MKSLLSFFLLLLACPAQEAPLTFEKFTTRDGRTFHQVKVVRFTGSRVQFIHAQGAAAVQIDLLPREIQDACGYDPDLADADMKRLQAERQKAVIQASQRRLQRETELAELKAKIAAMRLIEKQGVQMRLDVDTVNERGSFCRAWRIVPVEIPGKKNLSGGPLTKPGITQSSPDRIFVHGLNDARPGQALMKIVYPIAKGAARSDGATPYAIDTENAWRESKTVPASAD